MKELLFINPVFKQQIWGGNKLGSDWGYDIPGDNTGECWAIAAHPNGDGVIAEGTYKGRTLSDLWENEPELFNNADKDGKPVIDRFPLLTKIIDAKDNLSIQVHPDDKYAMENENGSLGKTECWYILDAPEGATLVVGHNAKTKEELADMIAENRWSELIREIPIKKGDFVQIYPGTVHAIKGGIQILETQQNSDITYRVYDYDRLTDGKPRQLHIKQSIDVITVPAAEPEDSVSHVQNLPVNQLNELISCDYYRVWKLDVKGKVSVNEACPYMLISVIDGDGFVTDGNGQKIAIKKGCHFIAPNGFGDLGFDGNMTMILATAN